MKWIALLAAVVVGLAIPVSASAWAVSGSVWALSYPQANAYVHITNLTTGASGSTYTGSQGYYSFGGLVAGNRYKVSASKCINGTYWSSNEQSWTQPNGNQGESLVMSYYVPNC